VVADTSDEGQQRLGVGQHPALVVDQRQVLAVGVDHRAEVGARRLDQAATRCGVLLDVEHRARPAVEAYGFTASTSAPSLASTLGITNAVAAVAVVDHQLEPALARWPPRSTVSSSATVYCSSARGGKLMSPISAGEHAAEVLALEEPLDLALGVLGDVEAVAVEEPDHDRLGVVVDEADRDTAEMAGRPGEEAGDRHGRDLEVEHVDAAALRPAIIARLSMRAARLESRDVTTVVPFFSVVA
jgi:hypothetical protein